MTQHNVISELACLVGEMAQLQSDQARLAEKQAGMQSRLGHLIRDLSSGTAAVQISAPAFRLEPSIWAKAAEDIERESARALRAGLSTRPERAQAATPADAQPLAQETGEPVKVGNASDAMPVRGVGEVDRTGKSEECRHDAGAGGESAASADTAPAADEKKRKRERLPTAAEILARGAKYRNSEMPADPIVTAARPPSVKAEGGGLVQDGGSTGESRGDQVLGLWASTTLTYSEIAERFGINPNTPGTYVSRGRREGDPRVAKGDRARGIGLPHNDIPAGLVAIINPQTGEVIGPEGSWRADRSVAKALNVLADGGLYDTSRMAKASGIKEDAVIASIRIWGDQMRRIGVELHYQRGYGCRLTTIQSEAA